MVQAHKAERRAAQEVDPAVALLRDIAGDPTEWSHPLHESRTAKELAYTVTQLIHAMEVVRSGARPESGPNVAVYDAAQSLDLTNALDTALTLLLQKARNREDLGEHAEELQEVLGTVYPSAVLRREGYEIYTPLTEPLGSLMALLRGGIAESVISEDTGVAQSGRVQPIPLPAFRADQIHVLRAGQEDYDLAINAADTEMIISTIGMEGEALVHFLKDLAHASYYYSGHVARDEGGNPVYDPALLSDEEAQRYAQALAALLRTIPSDKAVWRDPGFVAAVEGLETGDLNYVNQLSGVGVFSTEVWPKMEGMAFLELNQEAFVMLQAGAELVIQLSQEDKAEFLRYARMSYEDREAWLGPRPLDLSIGLYYQMLATSGVLHYYENRNAGRPGPPDFHEVTSYTVPGIGHAFAAPVSLSFGAGMWGVPVVLTATCTLGYREAGVATNFQTGDQVMHLETTDNGFYVGVWGVKAAFLRGGNEVTIFQRGELELGVIGDPRNEDLYMQGAVYFNWYEDEKLRVGSAMAFRASHIADLWRVGGSVTAAEIQATAAEDQYLSGALVVSGEAVVSPEQRGAGVFAISVPVGYAPTDWFQIVLDMGYRTPLGEGAERVFPSGPEGLYIMPTARFRIPGAEEAEKAAPREERRHFSFREIFVHEKESGVGAAVPRRTKPE